jgi:hypothetical protein
LDALLPEVDADLDHPPGEPIDEIELGELTRAAMVARLEVRGAQHLALTQADDSIRTTVARWVADPHSRATGRSR